MDQPHGLASEFSSQEQFSASAPAHESPYGRRYAVVIWETEIMDAIFSDTTTDAEFGARGYVVRPFLHPDEIRALTRLHEALPPDLPGDFYATVFSRNAD